jgi:CheY-like chemotaxis protein
VWWCVPHSGFFCIRSEHLSSSTVFLYCTPHCPQASTELSSSNDCDPPLCHHPCMMKNSVIEGRASVLNPKRENQGTAVVRILLVNDFEPCRTLVSLILQDEPGYQIVGAAADGPVSVQIADDLNPDLVVLDMGLQGMDGMEVARQIRSCSPGSTILFLTGNHDPEIVRQALYAGARGCVHKFDVVAELALAAKSVLAGKRFVSRRFRNLGVNGIS